MFCRCVLDGAWGGGVQMAREPVFYNSLVQALSDDCVFIFVYAGICRLRHTTTVPVIAWSNLKRGAHTHTHTHTHTPCPNAGYMPVCTIPKFTVRVLWVEAHWQLDYMFSVSVSYRRTPPPPPPRFEHFFSEWRLKLDTCIIAYHVIVV